MKEVSHRLYIDLETYSSTDLKKCGAYKYSESDDFQILLFGYAFDDCPVEVVDITKEKCIPQKVLEALTNDGVVKIAHSAQFERVCLSRMLYGARSEKFLAPEQWCDTMIMAKELGYPGKLELLGKAIGIAEDQQKLKTGEALIRYFCKPVKGVQKTSKDDHEKWAMMIEYNKRDVEVLRTIHNIFGKKQKIADIEWEAWYVDQHINDRGLACDEKLVDTILNYWGDYTIGLTEKMKKITGLNNPNSVKQLKEWMADQGVEVGALDKKAVEELLGRESLPLKVRKVLELKQEAGGSSVKKYDVFDRMKCMDGRIRGCFQFYGARTGRWASVGVQFQNIPRPVYEDDLDILLEMVKAGEFDDIKVMFGSLSDVLKTLIRPTIQAKDGSLLVVADYSAIEARVIAWLTRTTWRQDAFKNGEDIYCVSASQMFGVPVEKHGVNGHLRQKGKIAELALGYGGGVGALEQMGGKAAGWSQEEMQDIVDRWRDKSPNIKQFWYSLQNAFKAVMDGAYAIPMDRGLMVYRNGVDIYIKLPSGRSIAYVNPQYDDDGRITYMGMNQTTRKWGRIGTWGGKLTENVVQAIARDCLALTLEACESNGLNPTMHVHDEVINEVPEEQAKDKLTTLYEIMAKPISWAPGLILVGDGFISKYYKK